MKRLVLGAPDFLVFKALDRHGSLPTHYLFEFQKELRRNYGDFQKRLTEFYNGDVEGGPYLTRPRQQFASVGANYQPLVYGLAPRARRALAARDTLSRYSPARPEPFVHQVMSACVAASIELGAVARGLRYISREEILSHPRCPEATRRALSPLALPLRGQGLSRTLVPDDLLGFEYPGAGFRFFALEVDRNTEAIERRKVDQSSFARKVEGYFDVLRAGTYRERWGVPNLTVLTVTTSARRAAAILDRIARQGDPAWQERFAVAHEASFGAMWRVPDKLLTHLLDEPWATVGAAKDIAQP